MKYQVMPDLTPIEYEALKADIAERGVLVPVEVDESGDILDGHHRVKAWEELRDEGVNLPAYPRMVRRGLSEEQKRNHARSLNVLRRHLSREQRDDVMRAMRADGMTIQKIADNLGVGVGTVHRAIENSTFPIGKVEGADGKARPASYAPRTYENDTPTLDFDAVEEMWGPLQYGPIGRYRLKNGVKKCEKCNGLWSADLNYCPYCNISPDARALYLQRQSSVFVPGDAVALEPKAATETARQIQQERTAERRQERVEKINEIAQGNTALDTLTQVYPVVYADPPWRYEHARTENRAIENHYPTMTLGEICDLPVTDIAAEDAVLFLWATSPKLAESMEVIAAWGFTYRTCIVWDKCRIGMGYYARQQHELLLIATRGALPVPEPTNRPASVVRIERDPEHSAKPPQFYDLIERMYPEFDKVELFARAQREGWAAWGNQA